MNASTVSTRIIDDPALLIELNRKNRILLAPAIAYIVLTMTIGILGNPMALCIYACKWQNTTLRWFLGHLACVDLVTCLVTMPYEIYLLIYYYYTPNDTLCFLSRGFTYFCAISSTQVYLAIAVDRYIRICHPYRLPVSVRGAKITCIVSFMIGGAFAWPALFIYGSEEVRILTDYGFIRGVMCSIRNDMHKTIYPYVFFTLLSCSAAIYFIFLCGLYALIGRTILKMRRARDRGVVRSRRDSVRIEQGTAAGERGIGTVTPCTHDEHSHNVPRRSSRSTLTLLAITVVFVLSYLPFFVTSIIRERNVSANVYPSLSSTEAVLVNILIRSYLINFCTNPIVYGLCNPQFRTETRTTLRIACRHCGSQGMVKHG